MVCAEDVVSYFQSLKSYERIWIMCRLQHSCLPFELRFLGTCLEELGKKDFYELRTAEGEANSTAEITSPELRKISNRHVQKKIILHLSLLYSHNYSCSNSLFKILCNFDEINSILKYDASDEENDSFEHLLMIYTLAVNHPAFTCEQKQVLHNIFSVVQAEDHKRTNARRRLEVIDAEISENVTFNETKASVQECKPSISTSPENTYPHSLPNPSHCYPSVPPPFASDIPIPVAEQISIGLPATNFVRYQFPAATSPQLIPSGWNPAMPIVFSTTDHTNTTHTFMSRSSSPSISNTPSRSSSPSAKSRPLSAPFSRSPQMSGVIPHQPSSLPLPQTNDPFVDIKESPNLQINAVPNFTPEQLYRLSDEGLAALGMTEESIQQLRCLADKMQTNNDDLSPTNSNNKTMQYIDPETDDIKTFIEQSVPTTGLVYNAAMANPPGTAVTCSVSHPCQYCISLQNGNQVNGFVSPATADMGPCIDHMRMLRLESDAPSRNSNSSNSDTTSSEQSPPNTPMLLQANFNKRSTKSNSNSEWSNSNVNSNSDERGNAGDSSSEEKNTTQQASYQGRGRVISNRGRSKSGNGFSRGRGGNNRRRGESVNGNVDDPRKSQYAASTEGGNNFQYTTHPVTATVTNATYIQPSHYIRSYPAFAAAPNSFLRPAYAAFPPSGELLYHQYPPPGTFLQPGPIPYSPVVPPKLSCYNCGGQGHFANDCVESTMEEASKQGQFRLDYTPAEGPFTEK